MKIILTGGGTAGHVIPNIALMPKLKALGYEIYYIGSKKGMERELIEKENIPYFPISSGKLRRYLSIENIKDIFKVMGGVSGAYRAIRKIKPNIIFSKGGFVSVPVVLAARLARVPVICHESDITVGLANKISVKFADKICVSFPETLKELPASKTVLAKTPIRQELLEGSRIKGFSLCPFPENKPVLLVMGGSLGSATINELVRMSLHKLLSKYNIIHICGKGHLSDINESGYKQFEYVSSGIEHMLAIADIIVSRAGANAINEFLALNKPNLLIPLSKAASRGDQILNAQSFEKLGYSIVVQEEDLSSEILINKIDELYNQRGKYISQMKQAEQTDGTETILNLIKELARS